MNRDVAAVQITAERPRLYIINSRVCRSGRRRGTHRHIRAVMEVRSARDHRQAGDELPSRADARRGISDPQLPGSTWPGWLWLGQAPHDMPHPVRAGETYFAVKAWSVWNDNQLVVKAVEWGCRP
jgi:hypothetical protein